MKDLKIFKSKKLAIFFGLIVVFVFFGIHSFLSFNSILPISEVKAVTGCEGEPPDLPKVKPVIDWVGSVEKKDALACRDYIIAPYWNTGGRGEPPEWNPFRKFPMDDVQEPCRIMGRHTRSEAEALKENYIQSFLNQKKCTSKPSTNTPSIALGKIFGGSKETFEETHDFEDCGSGGGSGYCKNETLLKVKFSGYKGYPICSQSGLLGGKFYICYNGKTKDGYTDPHCIKEASLASVVNIFKNCGFLITKIYPVGCVIDKAKFSELITNYLTGVLGPWEKTKAWAKYGGGIK